MIQLDKILKKIRHELNYLKIEDLISVFVFVAAILPALAAKIYFRLIKRNIWLVTEDRNEARDNGICLFRYLNSPEIGQDSYYAISYKSPDYKLASSIGKTVKYGGLLHWILYLSAEFNISTQKAGRPGAAVGYVLEHAGLIKERTIFLQHGITLNRAVWLFYENTRMRLFICGAKPEYDYVVKEFGYPKENVAYLGFCRFDDYHRCHAKKKQILLIPSWREWIGSKNEYSSRYEDISVFENTEYFIKYQSLINNQGLISLLEESNIDLFFYPHRNMQQFIQSFSTACSRINIVSSTNSSIRDLLMESSLMVTDYSSVALDFAYMKKPVIFYQFDAARFREAQYEMGYFDYEHCGLGSWTDTEDGVIRLVKNSIDHDFSVDESFMDAHKGFFPLYDDKNCERIYLRLKRISNEKHRAVSL